MKKTTQTKSPKIKKTTSTYDKQWDDLEIPTLRGGEWKWNFKEEKMSTVNKVTLVLTLINVAILITLFVKNY